MTNRQKMIACLQELLPLLENPATNLENTVFVSSQQPFAELAHCLWHLRRGRTSRLWALAPLFEESGALQRLAEDNGWASEYRGLQTRFREAFVPLNRVRYHASEEAVLLGDHVALSLFFRRRAGRVTYVPGLSKPRAEIDFGGLFRVGIQVIGSAFVMVHVDGDTLEMKRGVEFLRRDAASIPACPTDEELQRDA